MNTKYLLVVMMACLVLVGCGTFEIETQEYSTPTPTEEVGEAEIGEQEPSNSDNALPKVPAENASTEFRESLIFALESRDFSILPSLMGEQFIVGYWLSEGVFYTPDDMVEQLRLNFLPTGSSSPVVFAGNPADLPGFDGVDQALNFGPDVNVEEFIYSDGWGTAGNTKTVLVIARGDDNALYWFGMLYDYVSPNELLGRTGDNHLGGIDSTITPEPTTESSPTLAPHLLETGIEAIDRILEPLFSSDPAVQAEIISLNVMGCTTADGLGGPPKCTEDQEDGSLVEGFPVLGPGEGGHILADELTEWLPIELEGIAAVILIDRDRIFGDDDYPAGEYGIVAHTGHDFMSFVLLHITETGVVRADWQMGGLEEILELYASEIIVQN